MATSSIVYFCLCSANLLVLTKCHSSLFQANFITINCDHSIIVIGMHIPNASDYNRSTHRLSQTFFDTFTRIDTKKMFFWHSSRAVMIWAQLFKASLAY